MSTISELESEKAMQSYFFTTITHIVKDIRIAFVTQSITVDVKGLYMISSEDLSHYRNHPCDLSAAAGITAGKAHSLVIAFDKPIASFKCEFQDQSSGVRGF